MEGLREITPLDQKLSKELFAKLWVVYCKRPFFGPEQVVEYLGRYTHKITIRFTGSETSTMTRSLLL
ncbi:MAG: transposase [Bacteroidales bacterium]|nr:transposase [Bacteroidales bacterium]